MTKFRIIGCNKESGEDVDFVIESTSYLAAQKKANELGCLVSDVRPAHEGESKVEQESASGNLVDSPSVNQTAIPKKLASDTTVAYRIGKNLFAIIGLMASAIAFSLFSESQSVVDSINYYELKIEQADYDPKRFDGKKIGEEGMRERIASRKSSWMGEEFVGTMLLISVCSVAIVFPAKSLIGSRGRKLMPIVNVILLGNAILISIFILFRI